MTRYLLLILFVGTIASRTLGLDFGVAPGISVKNLMLYGAASAIAVETALLRNRKVELLSVLLPFALLLLYALLTWLYTILFLDNPYYSPRITLIRLKTKLVDHFLILLVFFYGVINWKDALWLLKALAWVIAIGCVITVVESFGILNLGVITVRDKDGRVGGLIGDAQDFGGLLGFILPLVIALWWRATGGKKLLALIAIAMTLISLMLSASRGAMLGVVLGAVFAAFFLRRYITAAIVVRASLAALILVLVAFLAIMATDYGYMLQTRLSTGLETGNIETISSGRTAIWLLALREMQDNPLSFFTGMGWEAYYQTIGHRYATHSVYLDRLYNLGTIGLTLFALSFINAIIVARRSLPNAPDEVAPFLIASIIGLTSYMVSMAFSDTPGAAVYIWACMGLALRIALTLPQPQRDRPPGTKDRA